MADVPAPPPPSRLHRFALRVFGGSVGLLLALIPWSFFISRFYPAPHELSVLLEGVWGALVGMGLALGVAIADRLASVEDQKPTSDLWRPYLALPVSGLVGAFLWNVLLAPLQPPADTLRIASTWTETLIYGAAYGMAFGAGTLVAQGRNAQRPTRDQARTMFIFVLLPGALALVGFLLASAQPAFANQKDVDLVVGILLRTGLLLPVAALFPQPSLLHPQRKSRGAKTNL